MKLERDLFDEIADVVQPANMLHFTSLAWRRTCSRADSDGPSVSVIWNGTLARQQELCCVAVDNRPVNCNALVSKT